MALPLILMGVGTVMQIAGGINKNLEEAAQEFENAKWLEEQANFARQSMFREIRRTEQEYSNKAGQQIGAYAASGVDLSGSAALTVGGTIASAYEELAAVRRKGEMDIKLASSRARLATRNAEGLSSPSTNIMQGAGTLINNYTNTNGFGQGIMGAAPSGKTTAAATVNTGYGSAGQSLLTTNNVA